MSAQAEEESLGAVPSPSPTDTTGGKLPAATVPRGRVYANRTTEHLKNRVFMCM